MHNHKTNAPLFRRGRFHGILAVKIILQEDEPMKVLMLNTSPHEFGCTRAALDEIAAVLTQEGVDSEILWLGRGDVPGCSGCGACRKSGKCVYDDAVNTIAEKMADCDGFVVGSPVHYASASGAATSALDRLFYSAGSVMRHKPGAAIVSARRAGTTAALDQLNKYFTISQMPLVSSCYWNMVHGSTAADVAKDEEGVCIMRTLGRNMAWLLKCIAAGREQGLAAPTQEPRVWTNFIR